MSLKRLEEWSKKNITCPHCKDEDIDSWERQPQNPSTEFQEIECWNCGKKFRWRRYCEITYDIEEVKEVVK